MTTQLLNNAQVEFQATSFLDVVIRIKDRGNVVATPFTQVQAEKKRDDPGRTTAVSDRAKLVGKLELLDRNRPKLLAKALRFVEDNGGRVICPYGTLTQSGYARIEIVYEASFKCHNVIVREADKVLQPVTGKGFRIKAHNPAIVVITATEHNGITGEVTEEMGYMANIVQTMAGYYPTVDEAGELMGYSFCCIVSRGAGVSAEMMRRRLEPIALLRGGIVVVSECCTEFLLDGEFPKAS